MNKRQQRLWILTHGFVMAWMIVIFLFSAQPGDESADLSGGISHLFMRVVNVVFGCGWDEIKLLEMTAIWDYPIRKLAHMTEFGILSVLIFTAIGFYDRFKQEKDRFLGAWIFTACYAVTDEIHQLFVVDRSGNLFDVGVDSTGALIALIILYVVRKVYIKYRKR